MELVKVENEADFKSTIEEVLKTQASDEDFEDIFEGISIALEDGSDLYSFLDNETKIGFLVATPLSENNGKSVDIITMDEIWVKAQSDQALSAEELGLEIRKIAKIYKAKEIEVVLTQSLAWIGNKLINVGFVCSEIKFEKILPTPNNLDDVLELIKDCTPIDRIVQVLLEKEYELKAEVVENTEELEEVLEDGWIPVVVIVTFEPDGLNIEETIKSSNQIMNWDDYNLIYRGV